MIPTFYYYPFSNASMETEHFVTLASRRDRHRLFFLLFIFKGNPKFYQPRDCPFLSLLGQRKKKNWELKFWYMTKTISRSGKLNWRNFPIQGKVYPHVIPTFPYTVRPCLFVAKKRIIWTVKTRQRYLQQDAVINWVIVSSLLNFPGNFYKSEIDKITGICFILLAVSHRHFCHFHSDMGLNSFKF